MGVVKIKMINFSFSLNTFPFSVIHCKGFTATKEAQSLVSATLLEIVLIGFVESIEKKKLIAANRMVLQNWNLFIKQYNLKLLVI